MKTAAPPVYDVLVAYSQVDRELAPFVEAEFGRAGLSCFAVEGLSESPGKVDEVRSRLAECDAVVLIVSPSSIGSSAVSFEIGIALALDKRIHILSIGLRKDQVPSHLLSFDLRPLDHVSKLAQTLVKARDEARRPWNDAAREALVETYREFGIPTDRMLVEPRTWSGFQASYRGRTGKNIAGTKLMQELVRLRKQKKLPAIGRKKAHAN